MMLSLRQTTLSLLKQINLNPSRKLGQNFLIDENVVDKFLRLANPQKDEVVVEIGPGLGVFTKKILEIGAKVYAIELDKKLATFLSNRFCDKKNLNLMFDDAVTFPAADIDKSVKEYKIISNLPFAISSPWIDNLLKLEILPKSLSLIIQEETADRFFAECNTKSFCPISIFLQSAYNKTSFQKITNKSFYPIPNVSSAMVFFEKRDNPFIFSQKQKTLIRTIFTHRRKQIRGIFNKMNRPELIEWLDRNCIDNMKRPAQISIAAWQNIPA